MGPSQTISSPRARCVLWHAPGAEPPRTLIEALTGRGIEVRAQTSPYAVLAEACVLERASAGSGPGGTPTGVVLLVEPDGLSGPSELVRAVWAYAPRVVCWLYEPQESAGSGASGRELVRAVGRCDLERWSPAPALDDSVARALSGSGGAGWASGVRVDLGGLRLSGHAPRTDESCGDALHAPDERTEPPTPSQSVLTDDELAMLLAEDEPRDEGRVG